MTFLINILELVPRHCAIAFTRLISLSALLFISFFIQAAESSPKKGLTWQATYIGDTWYGFNGGLGGKLTYLGLADIKLIYDLEQLKVWKGATLVAEGQNLHSDLPALNYVKSYQGFDNIEYDGLREMTYLYQLYWDQKVNKKFSILFGLYDINNEFEVTDSSLTLILPTFGLGTDIGQTGLYGPSTYPVTGLTLRFKYTPSTETYIQTLVTDALAGNPANPANPDFDFSQGTLNMLEVGRLFMGKSSENALGKLGVGLWAYSDKMPAMLPPHALLTESGRNAGMYGLIDYPLYIASEVDKKILHGFIRYGYATPEVNWFSQALAAGLTWNGFIPKRPDDVISLGIAPAWTSAASRSAILGFPTVELQHELTYSAKIANWLLLQGDLQYINFINGNPVLFQDTFLAGLRFTLICSG